MKVFVRFLCIALFVASFATSSVLADDPAVSVTVWHPGSWIVVESDARSVTRVTAYPDLLSAKHATNALGAPTVAWHDVYQATAPTVCGDLTAEEMRGDDAVVAATDLASLLDCAPTAPATVRYLA